MLWVLVVILLVFAVAGLPHWGYTGNYGYYPSSIIFIILLVLVVLLLMGRV
jgi:uncharacterized membrane protein YphA (DoxX/SURF4 family)